jgi:hypothetical protein
MPIEMSMAMAACTSARAISRLGCVAEFFSARIACFTFISAVFGLSVAEALLYSAKSTRRFLRHFMMCNLSKWAHYQERQTRRF